MLNADNKYESEYSQFIQILICAYFSSLVDISLAVKWIVD